MIYEAFCDGCDIYEEYTRSLDECLNTPLCKECGLKMRKIITKAPKGFVKGTFEPFKSVVDGTVISTTRDLNEHNKRNGVVSLADGYDDTTVRSGTFNRPKPVDTKKEIVEDAYQAIQQLNQGYKPSLKVLEDE